MNVAFLDAGMQPAARRALMERALDPQILLGMPHLNAQGLSETWLMKELGHRHWLMLARALGMNDADFRTGDGRETYAAICATSLRDARLDLAGANDVLDIRSRLCRVSRSQYASRHEASIGGRCIADVELVSAFVYRTITNDNRSLVRMNDARHGHDVISTSTLATTAATLRRDPATPHLGMAATPLEGLRRFDFTPSATEEFNGAGLFYFAEFQAVAARALQTWFPGGLRGTGRRDMFFHGNIAAGEPIAVHLNAFDGGTGGIVCQLRRRDDSALATMFLISR